MEGALLRESDQGQISQLSVLLVLTALSLLQGLLRQLVLLPGSDATPRLCPSPDPALTELSIPQVLKTTLFQPDQQGPVYTYGEETNLPQHSAPCSLGESCTGSFSAASAARLIKKHRRVCLE